MTFLYQAQDAVNALEGFRSDPAVYALLVLLVLGIIAVGMFARSKDQQNQELHKQIGENNKVSVEAITAQVEVMRTMREDQKDALSQFNGKTDQILNHLIELKMRKEG